MSNFFEKAKNVTTESYGISTDSMLTPEIQQAHTAAHAKMMGEDENPTPHYTAYLRFEDEYQSKVKARNMAYAEASIDLIKLQNWPIEGVSYADDIDKAMDRWVSLGFKHEIESAIATLKARSN